MKTKAFFFLMFFFIVIESHAQRSTSFGIFVGSGIPKLKTFYKDPNSTFGRVSLQNPIWGGIYGNYFIGNHLYVGLDVRYFSQDLRVGDVNDQTIAVNQYRYIGIGPSVGFKFNKYIQVAAGLNGNQRLSSKTNYVSGVIPFVTYFSPKIVISPIDRISLDFGYELALKPFAGVTYGGTYANYYNNMIYANLRYAIIKR